MNKFFRIDDNDFPAGCFKVLLIGFIMAATIGYVGHNAFAAEKQKPILVILLASEPGIPAGYLDASTRPDATNMCNVLIASQSKDYSTPVSKSRCIIKVQE